jgi:hypothetical protein
MERRAAIEEALRIIAPDVPDFECSTILDHAVDSPGLRFASPQAAAWLSLVAFIRHALTDYDELLAQGYDTESARHFVVEDIDACLAEWGSRLSVGEDDGG